MGKDNERKFVVFTCKLGDVDLRIDGVALIDNNLHVPNFDSAEGGHEQRSEDSADQAKAQTDT